MNFTEHMARVVLPPLSGGHGVPALPVNAEHGLLFLTSRALQILGNGGKYKVRCVFSAIALLLTPACFAGPLQVRAELDRNEVNLGEFAVLTVAVEGSATASPPDIPVIAGLEIANAGRSTNLQFFNGAMSGGVTFTYQIFTRKEGTFSIPEMTISAGKEKVKTAALALRVHKSALSYGAPTPPPPPPTGSGVAAGDPQSSSVAPEMAMLQLSYPKRDFYVGELVPVELRAYFREGLRASIKSLPLFSGNAFTVSKLSNQPKKDDGVIVDGQPYTVISWHTAIAAVRAGDNPLRAQLECIVLISDRGRRNRPQGGFFDDPFFDNFFGNVQEKLVTLQTPENTVKTLPLPSEGRPDEFSGAIGQFQLSASASPSEVIVGDPITLRYQLTGMGNFDRVQAPEVEKNKDFKTYTPSSKLESGDEAGYTGAKSFEQVVIPQNTEVKHLPGLKFSYFDPQSRKYVSLASDPISLRVLPAVMTSAGPVNSPSVPSKPSGSARRGGGTELVPNRLELESTPFAWKPLLTQPWFLALQAFPLGALVIAYGIHRRRSQLANNPLLARMLSTSRNVRVQLELMEGALKTQNVHAFFTAARRALQERLGERFQVPAESITLSEVELQFQGDSAVAEAIRKIFEAADEVAYSGQVPGTVSLQDWHDAVVECVKRLEVRK